MPEYNLPISTNPLRYAFPCCRCGMCCLVETCIPGQKAYRVAKDQPCPGLSFDGDLSICQLAVNAGPKTPQAEFVIGIGTGCCVKIRCIKDGVTYDFSSFPPEWKKSMAQARRR